MIGLDDWADLAERDLLQESASLLESGEGLPLDTGVDGVLRSYNALEALVGRPGKLPEREARAALFQEGDPLGGVLFVFTCFEAARWFEELRRWSDRSRHSLETPDDDLLDAIRHDSGETRWEGVAAVSRALGMVPELSWAEDVEMLMNSAPSDLQDSVTLSRELQREIARVTDVLVSGRADARGGSSQIGTSSVAWEWKNPGRVFSALRGVKPDRFDEVDLSELGSLFLEAETTEECWTHLSRLHESHLLDPKGVRDYISGRSDHEYRALHTRLFLGYRWRRSPRSLKIRIHPRTGPKRWESPSRRLSATALVEDPQSLSQSGMIVYAADHTMHDLPKGSTVLDLAYSIHSGIPAFVQGGRARGMSLRPLDPLAPGDVVHLALREHAQPLPPEWKRASKTDPVLLKRGWRRAYGKRLRVRGSRRIQAELVESGFPTPLPLEELESIVLKQTRRLFPKKAKGKSDSWWLEAVGTAFETSPEALEILTPVLNDAEVRRLVSRCTKEAVEILIEREVANRFSKDHTVEFCEECRPMEAEMVRGTNLLLEAVARKVVRVHDRSFHDHDLNEEMQPISLSDDFVDQFILVEAEDRAGLASDLSSVFTDMDILLREIHGTQTDPGYAIVRLLPAPIPESLFQSLVSRIKPMPGVRKVWTKAGKPPTVERLYLPPRADRSRTLATRASGPNVCPFYVGNQVPAPELVYGPDEATDTLVGLVLERWAGRGEGRAVLYDKLRSGKSTVFRRLHWFLEAAHEYGEGTFLHVEGRKGRKDSWRTFQARIAERIATEVGQRFGAAPIGSINKTDRDALLRILHHVSAVLDIPVAISFDEFTPLVESSAEKGDLPDLLEALGEIQKMRGIAVCLIGPPLPFHGLSPEIREQLTRGVELPHRSFNEKETHSLFRAGKSTDPIIVSEAAALEAHRVTDGNPFLLQSIALSAWKHLRSESHGRPKFYRKLIEEQCNIVADSPGLLSRFTWPNTISDPLYGPSKALRDLVADWCGEPGRAEIPFEELRLQVEASECLDTSEMEVLVERLAQRGLWAVTRDRRGSRFLAVPPLLGLALKEDQNRRGATS